MADPLTFTSATSRFALPLLHAGQAQKEVFVNEALGLTDILLHCAVIGETGAPPGNSLDGDAWLVSDGATGEWEGHGGDIAARRGGAWIFVTPLDGTRIFDVSAGCEMLFCGFWRKALLPVEPLGGSSVDGEARATINGLVSALKALGILPSA
jgi:hypothetical protein